MKRVILFIILSLFIYASDTVVLSKKEKNTKSIQIEETTLIKKWLIDKFNAIMPDFLNVTPRDRMVNFKISYDTQNNKITSNLNIRVLLPAFVKIKTKTKINNNNISQAQYKLKILPIIKLYKRKITPILKSSFDFKNETLIKEVNFNETLYYYFLFNEYKEITTLTFQKFLTVNNLMLKLSKTYLSTEKNNLFYLFGLYYYSDFIKYIKTYGFEMSGERKRLPFIYSYKIFFTYRHILFGKRYIFADITPYLQASKEWQYKIKPFLNLSFNVRF